MLGEEEFKGHWFDRTKEYAARHRRGESHRLKYGSGGADARSSTLWKHLAKDERRHCVPALVAEIEKQASARREETGISSLGAPLS
jgi:hypothetical protein